MAQTGIAHDALHILAGAAWLGGSLWILVLACGLAGLAACRIAARIKSNGRLAPLSGVPMDIPKAGAAQPAIAVNANRANKPVETVIP